MELELELYRKMRRIRMVEDTIRKIYPTDKIKSPVHLSIGHEAIAVGVCHALEPTDQVFGYYRSHAMYLAKGGDLNAMMAELYGKKTGCAKGWGGSMHLVDTSVGVNSTTAIIASSIPNAVGYAYAAKLKGTNQVVVSFFGDGATEEGVVWESLNFAALHALPIIFICENNDLAIHTKQAQRQANVNIVDRAISFGIPAYKSQSKDPVSIYKEVQAYVTEMKEYETGPYFIEFETSRWLEHVGPNFDWNLGYRTEKEVDPWIDTCWLKSFQDILGTENVIKIVQEIENEIEQAVAFAESSEFPDVKELMNYVYR